MAHGDIPKKESPQDWDQDANKKDWDQDINNPFLYISFGNNINFLNSGTEFLQQSYVFFEYMKNIFFNY